MKNSIRKLIAVLAVFCLVAGIAGAAYADSAIDTILGEGTTQSFSDEPVSTADLETIVSAGLASVSAINQQPWYIVAINDADVLNRIVNGDFSTDAAPAGDGEASSGDGEASSGDGEASSGDGEASSGDGEAAGGEASSAAPAGGSSARASLGDSPAAIIIYKNNATSSPNPDFDCGLAASNMYTAAAALGYGVKIVTSPTMTLNGANHDSICELLGVDTSLEAVAVLLIGYPAADAESTASVRADFADKANIIG